MGVKFPVQHNEVRVLSYRTYATITALISLHVNLDASCEIAIVDARTMEMRTLALSATQVSATLGTSFLEVVESVRQLSGPAMENT